MKKFLTCLLAAVLVCAMVLPMASCNNDPAEKAPEKVDFSGNYTYEDAVSVLASNWNPHTYESNDDAYPADFLRAGLYSFYFNDEYYFKSSVGASAYKGYVIVPEMAAEEPIDVTEEVKAAHPEYNIPESATQGYAYKIKLNQLAKWQDDTPINADTYVYSMKQLFDPTMKNYRASDMIKGALCIANAKNYRYQGSTAFEALGVTVEDWLKTEGNSQNDLYIDLKSWAADLYGIEGYTGPEFASINDDTVIEQLESSAKDNWEWYLQPGAGYTSYSSEYVGTTTEYADNYSFDNVGIFKNDDYTFTIVLEKSLMGFDLLYNLSSNWIVYEPYYEACKQQIGETGAWTTTYNTSVETTMSYGPYKLTNYQLDKEMTFEKNENWYGYTDGKHRYVDPEDGKDYPMYQTTKVHCQVVGEAATRKQMFLKGQLIGYGLQADDFAEYRDSDYAYVTPDETIFFFIFNGYLEAIQKREANENFDQTKNDLETITLQSFRRAIAVTYDKEAFAATISPSRSGGYGLIGSMYIYDPDTAATYRDTPQAKKALCEFYSIDVEKDFGGDLDKAVSSITGYDPVKAKELFTEAFNEALAKGYITSADGKTSDQTIEIEYCSSATSTFITKTLAYLNEKLAEVLVGTPFEGKIKFVESAPYGSNWNSTLKNGMSDTVLAGWSGSALDPFGLTDLYVNPDYQYDAKWFNSSSVSFELTINTAKPGEAEKKETLTMSIKMWSDALNGTTVTVDGKEYNFGKDQVSIDTRLEILAKCESTILQTYNYIPMLQEGGVSLLSQKVFYVVDDYNAILGRGGITYLKYNYNDDEWTSYVSSQENGILKY